MGITLSHEESTEDCVKNYPSNKSDQTIPTMTDSTLSSRRSQLPKTYRERRNHSLNQAHFDKPSALLSRFPSQQLNQRKCKVDPHDDQFRLRPGTPMPVSHYGYRASRCNQVAVSSKKIAQVKKPPVIHDRDEKLPPKIAIPTRPGTPIPDENLTRKIPRNRRGESPSTTTHQQSHTGKSVPVSSSQPSFRQTDRSPSIQGASNLKPGSLITIGNSIRTLEEVKEAFDVISSNRNDESLPAPWRETERKISQYLSQNDGKTTPIECPPRFQERSDFGPVAVTHDVDYLERLYNIRTWNMHKLISDAREREDHSSNSMSYNYTYCYHHEANDHMSEGNDDMIFEMD
jgi:hypothetical protein